ncbi:MAG: hypothetical protein PVF47_01940 [Anaerolineae bacterium]
MKKRVIILVGALALIVAMLACSASSLISRNEPTPTPTKTPAPTFTMTLTPTQTPIPSDTPTPTATWTPTPEATNTPIVYTATPTNPPPTDTPTSPPPTNTPRPTRRPTRRPTARPTNPPQPTSPPQPTYEFNGTITGGTPNCGTTGIKGKIKTRTGGNYPGVTVAVWADGWEGRVSNPSDVGGNWDMFLNQGAVPGTWYAAVVKANTCLKNAEGALIGNSCERQSNILTLTTTAHCSGDGAVQWPEVQFQQN